MTQAFHSRLGAPVHITSFCQRGSQTVRLLWSPTTPTPNPLTNTPLFLTGVCMISGRKMPPPSQRKSFCCSQPGTQQTATLSQEERERDKEDRQERRKAQSALPRPLTALSKDLRGMLGVSNNQNIHKHGCAAFLSTDL